MFVELKHMMKLEIFKGCSALFRKKVPKATFYHCASHELNLALSKTAKAPEIKCMLSTLTSLGIFF